MSPLDVGGQDDTELNGLSEPSGVDMNGQTAIVLGIGVVSICSIGFVLMLPALAGVAVRGNRSAALRVATLLALLAAVALAVSVALGTSVGAYSILT